MKKRANEAELIRLLTAAKRKERRIGDGYTHVVQVLAPISMLQQVDTLLRRTPRVTRSTIFRRALTMYLLVVDRTKRPRRRTTARK